MLLLFSLLSIVYSQELQYNTLIDIEVGKYTDPYDNIYTQKLNICAFQNVRYSGCLDDSRLPASHNGRDYNVMVKVNRVSIDSFTYHYVRVNNTNYRDIDMWYNIFMKSIKSVDAYTGFGNGNINRHYVLTNNMQLLSYRQVPDMYIVNISIDYINEKNNYTNLIHTRF